MKTNILFTTCALACAGTAFSAHVFDDYTPFTENFNDYRGTSTTVPTHFFVAWDEPRTSEPFQGVNTGAFTAYTADGVDHSFGIRERDPVDLRDARLFFGFTNNTGAPVTGFNISYDVEAWFVGDRLNRIRLKYDNLLDSPDRDTFETDIFSTPNPAPAGTPAGTDLDGSLAENRTTVTGFVDLAALDDGTGNFFGPLADGETAWFRWQFSNLEEGESGSDRAGLGINNVSITPVPEPSAALLGALGALALLRRRR